MNTTPYIGCDYSQDRLESFVDGELPVDEQVAVESHVRWCRTCTARIEDLNLIGASVRAGSQALQGPGHSEPDLHAVTSSVLMRDASAASKPCTIVHASSRTAGGRARRCRAMKSANGMSGRGGRSRAKRRLSSRRLSLAGCSSPSFSRQRLREASTATWFARLSQFMTAEEAP